MYDELVKRLKKLADEQMFDFERQPYLQAADAIEELTRENESLAKSVNEASEILRKRWIPVTERLPEDREMVIISPERISRTDVKLPRSFFAKSEQDEGRQ